MFSICSKRFTPPIPAAKFVVSDNGEMLFPKKAPETTAPAVIALSNPRICPIPRKAIPIVETVVKELPTVTPTSAQTTKTVGKKNFTEIILKP